MNSIDKYYFETNTELNSSIKWAGADWVEANMKYFNPEMKMSDLGRNVANFLGELFYGIYHLDNSAIKKVEWDNTHHIVISIGWRVWSTVDFDTLTRLVFLAHHRALRVDLHPSTHNYMRLMFHQRNRSGDLYHRHPTLDEAVTKFKQSVSLPEYSEDS